MPSNASLCRVMPVYASLCHLMLSVEDKSQCVNKMTTFILSHHIFRDDEKILFPSDFHSHSSHICDHQKQEITIVLVRNHNSLLIEDEGFHDFICVPYLVCLPCFTNTMYNIFMQIIDDPARTGSRGTGPRGTQLIAATDRIPHADKGTNQILQLIIRANRVYHN